MEFIKSLKKRFLASDDHSSPQEPIPLMEKLDEIDSEQTLLKQKEQALLEQKEAEEEYKIEKFLEDLKTLRGFIKKDDDPFFKSNNCKEKDGKYRFDFYVHDALSGGHFPIRVVGESYIYHLKEKMDSFAFLGEENTAIRKGFPTLKCYEVDSDEYERVFPKRDREVFVKLREISGVMVNTKENLFRILALKYSVSIQRVVSAFIESHKLNTEVTPEVKEKGIEIIKYLITEYDETVAMIRLLKEDANKKKNQNLIDQLTIEAEYVEKEVAQKLDWDKITVMLNEGKLPYKEI